MKKLLSLILVLALICGMCASATASKSGNYTYKVLSDGTAEITEYNGRESSITIPEKIDGHVVSSIGSNAFMYNSASSITIKGEKITIKDDSFFGCKAKTIQIEAKDLVIGKEAFSCCSDIETFSIKANNTTIGKYAFMYAKPMKSFKWELADKDATGTKTVLEEGAFFSSNIVDITIPGDELVIGKEAFSCCSDIKSLTANCKTISIGNSAFMYANALSTFSAPNANSSENPGKIDENAFFSCGLSSFVVPGCITKIGKDAFSCCSSLKNVVVPATVTSIGSGAFSLCASSLVIKTEPGSAAEKYCNKEWGVKCEYLSTVEMSEIYGEHYDETASQVQEEAAQKAESEAKPKNETVSNQQHTTYGYMKDKWNWYRATFLSDSTLKIEKWSRWKAGVDGDPFAHKYDVCTIDITDGSSDFFWIDESQTAFSISLTDENDSDIDGSKRIGFALDRSDLGETTDYSYMNDKWDWYRAVVLSDSAIKVEKWSRFNAGEDGDPFAYDSDICIIQVGDASTDFAWTDDEHVAFTITMQDEDNSYWDDQKLTPFAIEPDPAKHACYTYQNDKWDLYKAYRLSDKTIVVEVWTRFNAGEDGDPFKRERIISIIKADDTSSDFKWTDDAQVAFTITMQDEDNSYWDGEKLIPFGIEVADATYPVLSYLNDRWDLYRAFVLSDNTIVIQDWTRFNAGADGDAFKRERDVCAIVPSEGTFGFKWTDDSHVTFTVTMQDEANSYWDEKQSVTFSTATDKENSAKIGGAAKQKATAIEFSGDQSTPVPHAADESTPEPTEKPTEAPTEQPTEAPTPAPVREVIDLSGYSDEDIWAMASQVQADIISRQLELTATLPEGNFIVGKEIPAGKYTLKLLSRDPFSSLTVRAKGASKDEDPKEYFYFGDRDVGKDFNLTIDEGDTVIISNCSVTITITKGIVFR